jgi:Kef-type K+ transport system membrane component KefB
MQIDYIVFLALILLVSLLVGEIAARFRLSRVVIYSLMGLMTGGLLERNWPGASGQIAYLADAALGLLLFELGYRLNPKWLQSNPTVLIASLTESLLTFLATLGGCLALSVTLEKSLAIASICIATSPGAILRIVREKQSSGQVTNYLLTLSALNCLFSILCFKLTVGLFFQSQARVEVASGMMLLVVGSSIGSAWIAAGLLWLLKKWLRFEEDSHAMAIALTVVCLTLVMHRQQWSPSLACLVFGMAIRRVGIKITGRFQDFGTLGRFATLFLFVYLSSRLRLDHFAEGLAIGCAIVVVRITVKTMVPLQFASGFGCSKRKAFLIGLGMWPVSAFAMAMLEQARNYGFDLLMAYPPMTVVIVVLEVLGPIATCIALDYSKETSVDQ